MFLRTFCSVPEVLVFCGPFVSLDVCPASLRARVGVPLSVWGSAATCKLHGSAAHTGNGGGWPELLSTIKTVRNGALWLSGGAACRTVCRCVRSHPWGGHMSWPLACRAEGLFSRLGLPGGIGPLLSAEAALRCFALRLSLAGFASFHLCWLSASAVRSVTVTVALSAAAPVGCPERRLGFG